MAAIAIVVIVVLIVSSKASRKSTEIQARGKGNLIPLLIIAGLIAFAFAGSH